VSPRANRPEAVPRAANERGDRFRALRGDGGVERVTRDEEPMAQGTHTPPREPRESAPLTAMLAGDCGAVKDQADQDDALQQLAAPRHRAASEGMKAADPPSPAS